MRWVRLGQSRLHARMKLGEMRGGLSQAPLARRASHAFPLIMRINWLPPRTFWLLHSSFILIRRPKRADPETRVRSFHLAFVWLGFVHLQLQLQLQLHLAVWLPFSTVCLALPPSISSGRSLAYFCKRLIYNLPALCGLATWLLPLPFQQLSVYPTVGCLLPPPSHFVSLPPRLSLFASCSLAFWWSIKLNT